MARLLAGTGTAQLLAAEDVAAAAGLPTGSLPGWQPPSPTAAATQGPAPASPAPGTTAAQTCPGTPSPGPDSGQGAGTRADPALLAVVTAELEAVYGYQAAVPRLGTASAALASDLLAEHADLAHEAEALVSANCAEVPPQPPGYVLDGAFLDAPEAGLARLEAGTLTALGDAVAFSSGPTRGWAVSALVAAARRTSLWSGDPGPVPGLVLDEARLPELPGTDSDGDTAASAPAG